ncbi:hypothetical protein FBY34_8810 [Streptomyces sp. SLBN-115]|nr:hypothetical protein FBY34_8810 [Streptomyces sp. SLBN-115]
MHFDLHQIRSRELIREADEYRLARQAREGQAGSPDQGNQNIATCPRRLLSWLRG